ncbi:MAG: HAD-IIIA family hydrolase [Candidatus Omnitrophota bacterium]|nr:HAD-IIIA family hydrolase [Candidatus Omnitrophota bacterium]
MMSGAIFLDRDGVINQLVYNPKTKEYESPLSEKDLKIIPRIFRPLKKLKKKGFLLFIISNQPSYAKGKTTLETLCKIHKLLHRKMAGKGIVFSEYFYCYHHPEGVVKNYSRKCLCRKPKPYFILKAKRKYGLDMQQSWFIGDQDCDVLCGQAAGIRSILIQERRSKNKRGQSQPDAYVGSLDEAVGIILKRNNMRS